MRESATLLRAGVLPSRAFELVNAHTSLREDDPSESQSIAQRIAAKGTPSMRIFAALWQVAEISGAPIAEAIERVATSLESLEKLRDRRKVLLTAPKYTLNLVSLLPILAVLFGELMGFEPLQVLVSPIGVPIIVIGVGFLGTGIVWSRALVKRVAEADETTGFEFDLLAVALQAGASLQQAQLLVVDTLDHFRVEWAKISAFFGDGEISRVLKRAEIAGQPHTPALRNASTSAQKSAMTALEERAEKLAIRALIPLSVCILPAFAVLGILPTVISMLGLVTHTSSM